MKGPTTHRITCDVCGNTVEVWPDHRGRPGVGHKMIVVSVFDDDANNRSGTPRRFYDLCSPLCLLSFALAQQDRKPRGRADA